MLTALSDSSVADRATPSRFRLRTQAPDPPGVPLYLATPSRWSAASSGQSTYMVMILESGPHAPRAALVGLWPEAHKFPPRPQGSGMPAVLCAGQALGRGCPAHPVEQCGSASPVSGRSRSAAPIPDVDSQDFIACPLALSAVLDATDRTRHRHGRSASTIAFSRSTVPGATRSRAAGEFVRTNPTARRLQSDRSPIIRVCEVQVPIETILIH
jgi:hypothetical protein